MVQLCLKGLCRGYQRKLKKSHKRTSHKRLPKAMLVISTANTTRFGVWSQPVTKRRVSMGRRHEPDIVDDAAPVISRMPNLERSGRRRVPSVLVAHGKCLYGVLWRVAWTPSHPMRGYAWRTRRSGVYRFPCIFTKCQMEASMNTPQAHIEMVA